MRVSVFIITKGSDKAPEKKIPIHIQMHFHSRMFMRERLPQDLTRLQYKGQSRQGVGN